MQAEGFEVGSGKIVDASFVEVPRQQNSSRENQQLKSGAVPEDWQDKPARMRQKDVDARWTTKAAQRL
jgi:IS5 family transposase